MNYVKKYFYNPTYRLAQNFAGVYFCGLPIFCVLRELIFAILDRLVFLSFFFYRMLQLLITKNEWLNRQIKKITK